MNIDELLEKNPEAKENFKKNNKLIEKLRPIRKRGYRLALPYDHGRVFTEETPKSSNALFTR